MTFPTVGGRAAQSFLSSTTAHLVDLGALGTIQAGRLALIIFNSGSQTTTTPSGWTALDNYNNGGARRAYVFAKVTSVSDNGAEVDCVTGGATVASATLYYFSDPGYVLATCVAAVAAEATGSSTTPNPPSLTSGFGSVDTTWIAGCNSGGTFNADPANYDNPLTSGGFGLHTADRNTTAASEDPGTFTINTSSTWCAFTLAVRRPIQPVITSVTPDEVTDALAGVVIAGSGFEASQGTGGVQLGDGPDYNTATKISQTETAWAAGSITFTVSKSTLSYGTLYVFVSNNSGFVSEGWPIQLIEPEPALLDASDIAAEMQVILFDGAPGTGLLIGDPTTYNAAAPSLTHTMSMTVPAGDNRLLVVTVATRNGPTTGVTFGGVAMTLAKEQGTDVESSIWYLIAPSVSTANVVATISSAGGVAKMSGIVYTGAHQTTPIRNTAGAGATSNAPSVTITSQAGDIVQDAISMPDGGTALTPVAGPKQATLYISTVADGETRGAVSYEGGAPSVTMSWTTNVENWAIAAVSIAPANQQAGAITELIAASIEEGINSVDYATFTVPYDAAGVSLATAMREISIQRIGEGELFRGFIVRIGTPVDQDGVTVVTFHCLSLPFEVQRLQSWRSILLLEEAAQAGFDQLLEDATGWAGLVTGSGYQVQTKEFINQSLVTAVGEYAELHSAYWRELAVGARMIEIKNYHSPSGIVLTNTENAAMGGQLGVLGSITQFEEDVSQVVNRVSFELKTDSSRLVTPQESSRLAPYTIQSVLRRMARVVSATLAITVATKVSQPFVLLGENRYALATYIGPPGTGDDSVASIGGQLMDNLGISSNDKPVWGAAAPPKGTPVVEFEDEAASATLSGVVGLENVDQFDPVFAAASNTGSSTTPSVNVSSDSNCLVIAFLILETIGTPAVTATDGQTLIADLDNTGGSSFDPDQATAWQKDGEASTTSFTWTIDPSQTWDAFAVALNPAKLHYIEDSDSQDDYGVSEHMLQLGSYNEVDNDRTAIANAAYDAMVYFLRKRLEPPRTYAASIPYLPGTPRDWRPGDTLRFLPYTSAVVDDERLICVRRTHNYDADGVRTWDLVLSNKPQMPFDETTLLTRALGAVSAVQSAQV